GSRPGGIGPRTGRSGSWLAVEQIAGAFDQAVGDLLEVYRQPALTDGLADFVHARHVDVLAIGTGGAGVHVGLGRRRGGLVDLGAGLLARLYRVERALRREIADFHVEFLEWHPVVVVLRSWILSARPFITLAARPTLG